MRILWHSPFGAPSAYAIQASMFAPRLAQLGHQVAISRMQACSPETEFEGLPVVGPASVEYAIPELAARKALGGEPDLVIVLKDAWVLNPQLFRRHRTAVWCNFDTWPMPAPDRAFFAASGATAIATSLFGQRWMADAGLDAPYIPHGIELAQWSPAPDRAQARRELGLPPDCFIIGMNAANHGIPSRKGFPEAFSAFAQFHGKHPNSLLACHTVPEHPEGMDLHALARALRIEDAVLFPSHGAMDQAAMLAWYRCLSVLLCGTYGEGFCLPVVEALACGVPVIATDCSAVTEKISGQTGWLVKGQRWWNPHHQSWWTIPNIGGLANALEKAWRKRPGTAAMATAAASEYDADLITATRWKPFLAEMEAHCG